MKSIHLLYLLLLVFLGSCQKASKTTNLQLDYYLNPQPTDLTFSFPNNQDSIKFHLEYWQHIAPRAKFDTIIIGSDRFSKSIPIEKPLLVEVFVGELRDEVFVLPGIKTHINYYTDKNELKAKISDPTMGSLNTYYDRKSSLIDHKDLRYHYSLLAQTSTYENVLQEFDLLQNSFLDLLANSASGLQLPDWFVEFETKNIKAATASYSIGLSYYQEYLGVKNDAVLDPKEILEPFLIEDTIAISTDFHLQIVELSLMNQIQNLDTLKGKIDLRHKTLIEKSASLNTPHIRDIFVAKIFSDMVRGGREYPKSLEKMVFNTISYEHHPYLNSLKNPPLKGKSLPYFYLKDKFGAFWKPDNFKEKWVLLNFWSTSCGPCYKQFDHEENLLAELKGKNFELVKICLNSTEEDWRKVTKEYHIKGVNLFSNKGWDKKIKKSYNNPAYSQYLLIDQNGHILIEKCLKPDDPELLSLLNEYISS